MKRERRVLKAVLRLAERQLNAAARQLAQTKAAENQARQQLGALKTYQTDYQELDRQSVTIVQMDERRQFNHQLSTAVEHAERRCVQERTTVDQATLAWREIQLKVKVLQGLVTQQKQARRRRMERMTDT